MRNVEEAHSMYRSHNAGRWLYNNKAQLKARYTPFNMGGLVRRVKMLVGSPVLSGTKLADTDNRAFLLTYENGTQIVARIATPISGPPVITTTSEVATMDFLHRIGFPVPKVLAYSAITDSTEVESEFILMEKADGTSLDRVSSDTLDVDFARSLADVLRPLVDVRFKCYGSFSEGVDTSPFCVGPITMHDFWEEERAAMEDVYRGPWTSALEYMTDTITCEQKRIERFAKPHMNDSFTCVLLFQGNEHDHIELLERYKTILPHLTPKEPQLLHGRLWHPNLHAGHVFASLRSGSLIAPAFLQLTPPKVYGPWFSADQDIITHPAGFDAVEKDKQHEGGGSVAYEKEAGMCAAFDRRAFGDLMLEANVNENGRDTDAVKWKLPELKTRQYLEHLSRRTWQMGLVPFRKFLVDAFLEFDVIAPGTPCPISFTPEEVGMRFVSINSLLRHLARADELCVEFRILPHGYVRIPQAGNQYRTEYFEKIRDEVERRRVEFVDEAGMEKEERRERELMWPFRGTMGDEPRECLPMRSVVPDIRELLGDGWAAVEGEK
ncbi:hypothetical protein BDN70DRAFT_935746 [Pholiota conissans]|uniref:Altered inheritance of mitochondria protein 9, mitochondrial n=1 Tax=Pholiota conissans TaxID=109636 RepID=A0A9P5YU21_9AGAR|nr:hypothetical protein BDN70DRAFT_935746 [Pholiota conissans]